MADRPVEVRKAPAPVTTRSAGPDPWQSFRGEMDRSFDRFGFPSIRRMFDVEPFFRHESSLGFALPAVDVSEDEKA